ncbi:MAG: addiction module antitoxin [Alphaproteobacteria bacterium RIFOXYD12_FULL_60_8]|nr:MAG: addiction module antitoxin [Alphaproteobacteria bacterium RIFOXYD12_FULL_60_8]
MRTIERSALFKRDYKKVLSSPRHGKGVERLLHPVLTSLLSETPLSTALRDHALIGEWKGYRECHLKPDLLLIYRLTEDGIIRLARIGSHSDLFG